MAHFPFTYTDHTQLITVNIITVRSILSLASANISVWFNGFIHFSFVLLLIGVVVLRWFFLLLFSIHGIRYISSTKSNGKWLISCRRNPCRCTSFRFAMCPFTRETEKKIELFYRQSYCRNKNQDQTNRFEKPKVKSILKHGSIEIIETNAAHPWVTPPHIAVLQRYY